MAESNPLEAAAMSDEQLESIRRQVTQAWSIGHECDLLAEVDRLRARVAAYEAEQTTPDLIPPAYWSSSWAQLTGYVQQAVEDGEGIDAASLLRYLAELKREALAPVLAHLKGEGR